MEFLIASGFCRHSVIMSVIIKTAIVIIIVTRSIIITFLELAANS